MPKFNLTTLEGNLAACDQADDQYVRLKESKEMSNTPRTDALLLNFHDSASWTKLMEHARQLERELIAAYEERDEKDKELARLRFRVKRGVWPPAGLPENEWDKHAQEWPHAESTDIEPVYAKGIMVLVPRRTYQFAVILSAICGFILGVILL